MKFQNVYESNFDYEATYEALLSTLKGVDITRKGFISFRFKPKNIEVLLSRYGRVQVAWSSPEEKEEFFPVLKSLLVPPKGQKITLRPLHTNIFKVEHPGPEKLTFAWCKEKVSYVRNLGFWNYLKWRRKHNEHEREMKRRKFDADVHYGLETCNMNRKEWTVEKDFALRKKWYKRSSVWPETDEE